MTFNREQIVKVATTIMEEFSVKPSKVVHRRLATLITAFEKSNTQDSIVQNATETQLKDILNRYTIIYKEAGNPVPYSCPDCPIYNNCAVKDWTNADCREKIEQWIVTGKQPLIKEIPLDKDPLFIAEVFYGNFIETLLVIMDQENISEEDLGNKLGVDENDIKALFSEELTLTPQLIAEIGIALNRIPKITFTSLKNK